MKTLFVHIGTPKTGTTSIQHLLCRNRSLLEKQGYCYPDFSDLYPGYSTSANGRFLVQQIPESDGVDSLLEEKRRYKEGMERVIALFSLYDHVILSNEAIFRATYKRRSDLWEQLKDAGQQHGFSVKVIIFLRRQDQYAASLYNQNVKVNTRTHGAGLQKTWKQYITPPCPKERSFDYYERLESIRAVLGKDAMIVRRFDKKYFYKDSLQAEFLHLIGLEYTDEYQQKLSQINQSLPGNTLEIMRLLNEIESLDEDERTFFRRALYQDAELSSRYYKTCMFSKEETKEFLARYEEGNRRIAEEYLGDGEPLFDDTIADLPKYERRNEYMIDDVIRFTALCTTMLMRENNKLRKEHETLKNKMMHPAKTIWSKLRS